MKGHDYTTADKIRASATVPLTLMGDAGSMDDVASLIARFGIIGVGAGSLFVFKGTYKAVLISYPEPAERDQLQLSGRRSSSDQCSFSWMRTGAGLCSMDMLISETAGSSGGRAHQL